LPKIAIATISYLLDIWCVMVMSPVEGGSPSEAHTSLENQVMDRNQRKSINRAKGPHGVSSASHPGLSHYCNANTTIASLDGLEALQQSAKQRDLLATRVLEQTGQQVAVKRITSNNYAAPLTPLRERDTIALSEWFEQVDIDKIEADVVRYLLILLPTPCWEDDPFAFLEEYGPSQSSQVQLLG